MAIDQQQSRNTVVMLGSAKGVVRAGTDADQNESADAGESLKDVQGRANIADRLFFERGAIVRKSAFADARNIEAQRGDAHRGDMACQLDVNAMRADVMHDAGVQEDHADLAPRVVARLCQDSVQSMLTAELDGRFAHARAS